MQGAGEVIGQLINKFSIDLLRFSLETHQRRVSVALVLAKRTELSVRPKRNRIGNGELEVGIEIERRVNVLPTKRRISRTKK